MYHCKRIKEFNKWIEENYKRYHDVGVTKLTPRQKADEEFYRKSTHDLIFNGLNIEMFKSFLAFKKWKTKKDETKSQFYFVRTRKHKDTILRGAKRAKKSPPC